MLLSLLFVASRSTSVISHAADAADVSGEFVLLHRTFPTQIIQFTASLSSPLGQIDAISHALVSISREAFTIALLIGTLTHVTLAELEILVGIDTTQAISEIFFRFEVETFLLDSLLLFDTSMMLRLHIRPARTSLFAAHTPTVCELSYFVVGQVVAAPRHQIVTPNCVIVAAQSAQFAFVAHGRLELQKVVAVPCQFDTYRCLDDDNAIPILEYSRHAELLVRQLDSRAIHLHPKLLTEIDSDICRLERDCLRTTGQFLLLCSIVCDTNRECVINTISCQLILARSLKAEELAIECFVMRNEDTAHSWNFNTFCTALTLAHLQSLVWLALRRLWTFLLCTANFARSTFTALARSQIPCLIILAG